MGNAFVERLKGRHDGIIQAIRDAMVHQVRGYGELSSAHRTALLDEVSDTWTPVLTRAATGDPFTEEDLDVYRDLARKRALIRFSLTELRAGFDVAFAAGLRECLTTMEPGDSEGPVAFTVWGVREQPRVVRAVTEAYADGCHSAGDEDRMRELLVQCLVEGRSVRTLAATLGMDLPSGFLVLLCRPGPAGVSPAGASEANHTTDTVPTAERLAVARTLNAVPGSLWRLEPDHTGMLILLPVTAGGPTASREAAIELCTALSRTSGTRLHVAEAYAETLDALPSAVREARHMLPLVAAMPDARSRPYRSDELLVELAVTHHPYARRRLIELLGPLSQGTDLRRTLEVLFDCGLDREKATKALFIHRRTLTYRIRRIRELTGLDPATAHGITLLRTALTIARLAAHETGGPLPPPPLPFRA